jgi:hypothetical protein
MKELQVYRHLLSVVTHLGEEMELGSARGSRGVPLPAKVKTYDCCYAPDMNPWILALNMHELMDCILPYPLTGSFDKTPGG